MVPSHSADSAPCHKGGEPAAPRLTARIKPEHLSAMAEAGALPPGAEEISFRGFSRHVGPLYRLAPGHPYRFGFLVESKHMNAAGTVHGGMLMGLADVAMSRATREVTG